MSNFHADGSQTIMAHPAPFPWLTVVCLAGIALLLYNIAKWLYHWVNHWWSTHVRTNDKERDYDDYDDHRRSKKGHQRRESFEEDDENDRHSPRRRRVVHRDNDDYD